VATRLLSGARDIRTRPYVETDGDDFAVPAAVAGLLAARPPGVRGEDPDARPGPAFDARHLDRDQPSRKCQLGLRHSAWEPRRQRDGLLRQVPGTLRVASQTCDPLSVSR